MSDNHLGHRERMRKRLRESSSLENFTESEILEMLLFYVFPRGDTSELAKTLISKFGSLRNVLTASKEELLTVKDIGDNSSTALRLFGLVCEYMADMENENVNAGSYNEMLGYVEKIFDSTVGKKFKLFCIDDDCKVQGCFDVSVGKDGRVVLDYKKLTKDMINSGCSLAAVAHNHLNGDNTPSQEDIILTRKLMSYFNMLDITLMDHYIVGTNGVMSMRNGGFIFDMEC